ncbi:MAG TPA: hypothetical protein VFO16_15915 [Pseudonocardiaceae bacterium]|nr:hypothetical protein [Pseudonocardiaceae bacterium]
MLRAKRGVPSLPAALRSTRVGASPRALLEVAALRNNAHLGSGGTEGALLAAAAAASSSVAALRAALPRIGEVPFDSVRREMRTRHAVPGGEIEIVKVPRGTASPLDRVDPSHGRSSC